MIEASDNEHIDVKGLERMKCEGKFKYFVSLDIGVNREVWFYWKSGNLKERINTCKVGKL